MAKNTIPKKMQVKYDEIVAMTDAFCQEHLTAEYAEMCQKLAGKLARKRPSPLLQGRTKTWYGAIIYTIARVNFLFDRSQELHFSPKELSALMGVNQTTVSGKTKQIMDMFKIGHFEPEWTLPSRMDSNPLAWMLSVNGFIMDVRSAPLEVQEEALDKGLIPYIPDPE